jgi:hypothetical protein
MYRSKSMILNTQDLLDYITTIGESIQTLNLEEDAKTEVFVREAGKVIKQAEEALEHATD